MANPPGAERILSICARQATLEKTFHLQGDQEGLSHWLTSTYTQMLVNKENVFDDECMFGVNSSGREHFSSFKKLTAQSHAHLPRSESSELNMKIFRRNLAYTAHLGNNATL